jgi:hypothetical protein
MRNKLLIWAIVLVAVFLVGFLPPYIRCRGVESELARTSEQLDHARLLNLAGLAYMQAVQKNYGLASETSTAFFNRAREVADQASTAPERRKVLEEVMGARDRIISGLAKGDPAVLDQMQEIFVKIQPVTAG